MDWLLVHGFRYGLSAVWVVILQHIFLLFRRNGGFHSLRNFPTLWIFLIDKGGPLVGLAADLLRECEDCGLQVRTSDISCLGLPSAQVQLLIFELYLRTWGLPWAIRLFFIPLLWSLKFLQIKLISLTFYRRALGLVSALLLTLGFCYFPHGASWLLTAKTFDVWSNTLKHVRSQVSALITLPSWCSAYRWSIHLSCGLLGSLFFTCRLWGPSRKPAASHGAECWLCHNLFI